MHKYFVEITFGLAKEKMKIYVDYIPRRAKRRRRKRSEWMHIEARGGSRRTTIGQVF